MPVPKRRKSKSRRDMRKAHTLKIDTPATSKCSNCGSTKQPHRVCGFCGFYKGREVIRMDEVD